MSALRIYTPPRDTENLWDYTTGPSRIASALQEGHDTLQALQKRLRAEFSGPPMLPGIRTEVTELWLRHLQRLGWAYMVVQARAAELHDVRGRDTAELYLKVVASIHRRLVGVLASELPPNQVLDLAGVSLEKAPEKVGDFCGIPADHYRKHCLFNLRQVVWNTLQIVHSGDAFEALEWSWAQGLWTPEEPAPTGGCRLAPLRYAAM